jgi:putative endonuclease
MAKAKKKKSKGKTKGSPVTGAATGLKSLASNPLVAEIVAAALVSTAAAIKEPRKARQLAAQAGDELTALAQEGAEKGNAMWQLALDVGRRAIESLGGESAKPAKRSKPAKASKAVKVSKPTKSSKPAKAAKKPNRNSAARKSN